MACYPQLGELGPRSGSKVLVLFLMLLDGFCRRGLVMFLVDIASTLSFPTGQVQPELVLGCSSVRMQSSSVSRRFK